MLKGHTKVELFDALTGKKQEEVEKDNLVTNAAQYAMALAGEQQVNFMIISFRLPRKAWAGSCSLMGRWRKM